MKLLFILNIANRLNSFSYSSMLAAKQLGIDFQIAGNWGYSSEDEKKEDEKRHGIRIHQIDFYRNPFHPGNIKAFRQLGSLMERERYNAVHCNTPVGGLLGRICAKQRRVNTVIYSAHGFHFYKGAEFFNRTVIKFTEIILARWTDAIITMNEEDSQAARKFYLRNAGKVYKTHGVGIDTDQYINVTANRENYCKDLRIHPESIIMISVGDLIERKGYEVSIQAMENIKKFNVCLLICGEGPMQSKLKALCRQLDLEKQVRFLGFRNDIKELLSISDVFILSSKQEGLPRSLMEAMASGLPCIVSGIRGNVDLLEDGKGGFLCEPNNQLMFSESMMKLFDSELRQRMGKANIRRISEFSMNRVIEEMVEIYCDEFNMPKQITVRQSIRP